MLSILQQLAYHEAERLVIAVIQTSSDFRLKRSSFPISRVFMMLFGCGP
jgi:hypothetical protein